MVKIDKKKIRFCDLSIFLQQLWPYIICFSFFFLVSKILDFLSGFFGTKWCKYRLNLQPQFESKEMESVFNLFFAEFRFFCFIHLFIRCVSYYCVFFFFFLLASRSSRRKCFALDVDFKEDDVVLVSSRNVAR
jgi:hypothetical protein